MSCLSWTLMKSLQSWQHWNWCTVFVILIFWVSFSLQYFILRRVQSFENTFWRLHMKMKTVLFVCVTYSQYWVFITLEAADWRCVSALWRPGQRGTLAPGVFLWATGTAGQDSVCLDSATLQRSALSDCEETRLQLPETAIKTQCNTISRQFDDSFILD